MFNNMKEKEIKSLEYASNRVIRCFAESFKKEMDKGYDPALLEINQNEEEFRNLFAEMLHKEVTNSGVLYDLARSIDKACLTEGLGAYCGIPCSTNAKGALNLALTTMIATDRKVFSIMDHNRELFYITCVMNFNSVLKELKKNGRLN